MEFPISVELRNDDIAGLFCRWCGKELNDKRKRYCCRDHRDKWINEVYLREQFYHQRELALKRDGYKCQRCAMSSKDHKKKFKQDLHVHHKVPRSMNGSNYIDNLTTLCRDCHIKTHKENGLEIEWVGNTG